jgi:regulator of sigma E protease
VVEADHDLYQPAGGRPRNTPISSRADQNRPGLGNRRQSGRPFGLVSLIAVLSVSIGLINLFPIPLLDGGHLLFYGIEALRGRPLSDRAQEIGFRIGLALVVMLMLFATWNDIVHLGSSFSSRGT